HTAPMSGGSPVTSGRADSSRSAWSSRAMSAVAAPRSVDSVGATAPETTARPGRRWAIFRHRYTSSAPSRTEASTPAVAIRPASRKPDPDSAWAVSSAGPATPGGFGAAAAPGTCPGSPAGEAGPAPGGEAAGGVLAAGGVAGGGGAGAGDAGGVGDGAAGAGAGSCGACESAAPSVASSAVPSAPSEIGRAHV